MYTPQCPPTRSEVEHKIHLQTLAFDQEGAWRGLPSLRDSPPTPPADVRALKVLTYNVWFEEFRFAER